jgi:hypothetical protein
MAFLQRNSLPDIGFSGFMSTLLVNWTFVGAMSGAVFALGLSGGERRRSSLRARSMRRVVSWGAIGGAALPPILIPLLPIVAPRMAGQLPAVQIVSAALRQAILAASVYGVLGAIPPVRRSNSRDASIGRCLWTGRTECSLPAG